MTTTITALPTPTPWDLKHLEQCDPSVRLRRLVEIAIVRKLVSDIIAAGHTITVDDGDDEPVKSSEASMAIIEAAFAVDECFLYVHKNGGKKVHGWIRLIYGNDGWDVINDYTTNLEDLIKPTNDYAEALSAWF